MFKIAVICLATVAYAQEIVPELITTVASQHWTQNQRDPYQMRQFNPGVGLCLSAPNDSDFTPVAVGVMYHDSYQNRAELGAVGMRYDFASWVDFTLSAGYANTGGYHGFVAVPTLGIGYDRAKLDFSIVSEKAMGLSIRVRL